MFTVSLPALFGALYIIALVLLFVGIREQGNMAKRLRLMRMGGVLLGFTTILLGFMWYATQPQMALLGYVEMRLEDLLVLTMLSSVGGVILGFALRMD
jgi:hypothetical protein